MDFKVDWDDEARAHIAGHGIEAPDVEEVLERPYYWRKHSAGAFLIGHSRAGVLVVILGKSSVAPQEWRVKTARRATGAEKRLLARRGKGFR